VLGGGVVETGVSVLLQKSLSKSLSSNEALTLRAFSQVTKKQTLQIIEMTSFFKVHFSKDCFFS
jgi:chaperonin GroEL (HSP60 family)